MRLLDDNPTTDDQLGFGETAGVLFDVITGASNLPLTVGVFGGWGSGKTSLMKMAEKRLVDKSIKTVWFNAWKYNGKEVIWNALIQTIFYAMKTDPEAERLSRGQAFRERVVHASKELAKYSAKVGTRFVPGGILREEDVDAVLAALGSSADDELFEFVNRFETEFDKLVKEYVGDDGYLVVFIDDLDRCLPENAIEVMEALKLYLDRSNCVFVVGVEPGIIEEAIRRRYNDNPSLSATEYLEKIVQIPLVVPRTRTKMALSLAAPAGDGTFPQGIRKLIRIGTNRNPRRVKRFLNGFTIASRIAGELSPEEQLSLAKILLIQMRFPDFYRSLMEDSGRVERLSDADLTTWEQEGLGRLYKDVALRQFLRETHEIPSHKRDVRRWVRVADVQAASAEELEDEADDELTASARLEGA